MQAPEPRLALLALTAAEQIRMRTHRTTHRIHPCRCAALSRTQAPPIRVDEGNDVLLKPEQHACGVSTLDGLILEIEQCRRDNVRPALGDQFKSFQWGMLQRVGLLDAPRASEGVAKVTR
jgi:hypothetical protein